MERDHARLSCFDSIADFLDAEAEDGPLRRQTPLVARSPSRGASTPSMVSAVVSRTKKLTAAATVLTVGLVLAWPLRKTGPSVAPPHSPPPAAAVAAAAPVELKAQFSPQEAAPATMVSSTTARFDETSLAVEPPDATPSDTFSGVPTQGRPAYSTTIGVDQTDNAQSEPSIHVVHNGDTLERLAKRYLGNESRALEIFDANRDVLTNPNLLPIGAELRMPGGAEHYD